MYFDYVAELLRSIPATVSRRGVMAGVASGLFAAGPYAHGADETEAKKNGRRKRKKKRQNQQQPLPPSPSGPVIRADATCAGQTAESAGTDGNSRLAQTFTALSSGPLVSAQLQITKVQGSAGDYILQLATVDNFGRPTNEVLAKTSVANVTVPDGPSTVTFTFAKPAPVVAGTQYALVLTRSGAVDFFFWQGQRGDACAGGAFNSPNQTAPFEAIEADTDLIFTTFVSS